MSLLSGGAPEPPPATKPRALQASPGAGAGKPGTPVRAAAAKSS